MNSKKVCGYILIVMSLIISFYMFTKKNILIPAGYDLAIDGYVVSRTLMLIFILYITSKLAFHLLENEKDQ